MWPWLPEHRRVLDAHAQWRWKHGAKVALVARNQQKLEEVAHEIANKCPMQTLAIAPGRFPPTSRTEDQVEKASKPRLPSSVKVDILVNNAGITRDQLIMRIRSAQIGTP